YGEQLLHGRAGNALLRNRPQSRHAAPPRAAHRKDSEAGGGGDGAPRLHRRYLQRLPVFLAVDPEESGANQGPPVHWRDLRVCRGRAGARLCADLGVR
ncbi:unnamed protein product, partial [Symbiodinium microadriaticum]